jgi:hypothetical protein
MDAIAETVNYGSLVALRGDPREIAATIYEAGKQEGRRAKREVAHAHLYRIHANEVGAVWRRVLKRVPKRQSYVDSEILAHARASAAAGDDSPQRRRVVATFVAALIRQALKDDDRAQLDQLNADGWAHASAYGSAEASSTPRNGSMPLPDHVDGLANKLVPEFSPHAAQQSHGWTNAQLAAIAAGAAVLAGNGLEKDQQSKVVGALSDGDYAERDYVDSLHSTVVMSYMGMMSGLYPEALYNLVTTTNACDVCLGLEQQNPYSAIEVPEVPVHPNCQCNLELAQAGADELTDV